MSSTTTAWLIGELHSGSPCPLSTNRLTARSSWRPRLQQLRSQGYVAVRNAQRDVPVLVMEAGDEALRLQRADLLFREVDDGDDKTAHELLGSIEIGDPG